MRQGGSLELLRPLGESLIDGGFQRLGRLGAALRQVLVLDLPPMGLNGVHFRAVGRQEEMVPMIWASVWRKLCVSVSSSAFLAGS